MPPAQRLPGRVAARIWREIRPFDPLRSIKGKLGLLVSVSVVVATGLVVIAIRSETQIRVIMAFSMIASLLFMQLLAHTLTAPLREMTAAARAMAGGDYSRRVTVGSRDEIGELAVTFNKMAADLEAADRHRRELVANVSHELRTPIAALQAVLENMVDGVVPPEQGTWARHWSRPSGSAAWSPTCWTCPSWTTAWCRWTPASSRSPRSWPACCAG